MPQSSLHRFVTSPRGFQLLATVYPPLLGAGIRVRHVAPDWTHGELVMTVGRWTANLNGAAFGGALFSATDVLYGTLLAGQLGKGYQVWTRSATIYFLRPGRGRLTCMVDVPASDAEQMRRELESSPRAAIEHHAELRDSRGEIVARAHHTMSVRTL